MSEETVDTGTLQANEDRLRLAVLATLAVTSIIDVYLLAISASTLSLVPWLLLTLACIVIVGLNVRCLLVSGPTMGMIPIALASLAPASLAGSRSFVKFTGTWWACVAISSFTFALCAYMGWWFRRLESVYEKPADPRRDAVLVVLGGLVKNGEPTPTLQKRLEVAAALWREAPSRVILVTGGPDLTGTTTEAEVMRQWLIEQEGVPEENILVEPHAINTSQNIAYATEALAKAGLSKRQFCIVTSDYHLYRALAIARHRGIDAIGVPSPIPSSSALQQWCREVFVILSKGFR